MASDRLLERVLASTRDLRERALRFERTRSGELGDVETQFRESARNLLHYLGIRQRDIRSIHRDLHSLVLSSLGLIESHTLASLNAVSRQVIHGEKADLARLTLKAGGGAARHYHANEEYAWVVSGALEYRLDDRTVTVRAGEVIVVPSDVPHAIVAPEDSICIYFFAPVREDCLKGEDQYLRKLH